MGEKLRAHGQKDPDRGPAAPSAPKGRQIVAQGVSPAIEGLPHPAFGTPLPRGRERGKGRGHRFASAIPGLSPWATFFRSFGAGIPEGPGPLGAAQGCAGPPLWGVRGFETASRTFLLAPIWSYVRPWQRSRRGARES